jgi:PHD/YefM family antitoxin component YafN of YafNO toxin-antitoxin module
MSEMQIKGKHESAWVTISTDEYESLLATIETLSSPDAMKKIGRGEKERLEGKLKSLEQVKKELGI